MLTNISCVQAPSFLVLPTHCSQTKPIHPLAKQPPRPWRHQENRSSDLHTGCRRACLGLERFTCRSPALTLSAQFSHSVLSGSVTPWTTAHQASLSITNTLGMWKAVARLRAKSFRTQPRGLGWIRLQSFTAGGKPWEQTLLFTKHSPPH